MEEKVEKEIERKETDNNSLPNKKKEKYVELLRPRIAKWVESKAYMREQFTIEEAKRMMRENPDQKLIDVAFNVGFSSLAYFSSVFSKIEGVSPSVWLRKN